MNPLVSAVIPAYNYRRYVTEAVESVLAQTYRPIEIIVVDDGSTDGTREELRPFEDCIRYVFQENRGLPAARNLGIRTATGEYLGFLDADDLWAPTKIEKQMALLQRSPQAGVAYCGGNLLDLRSGVCRPLRCRPGATGDIRRRLLQRNCVTGSASAVLVRRACFDTVGLFDETLRSAEDWDMWIRISRHFHFVRIDEPLVTLRNHGANMRKKIETMHKYQMQVVERALQEDPIDGARPLLRRRVRAHFHWDTGTEYYWTGEYRPALRHLAHSIALWPFSYASFAFLARVLVRGTIARKPAAQIPAPHQQPAAFPSSSLSVDAEPEHPDSCRQRGGAR